MGGRFTGAHLPIDGRASGMGILPMSEGLTQTHGQDARATASIPMLPSIGRCALFAEAFYAGAMPDRSAVNLTALSVFPSGALRSLC